MTISADHQWMSILGLRPIEILVVPYLIGGIVSRSMLQLILSYEGAGQFSDAAIDDLVGSAAACLFRYRIMVHSGDGCFLIDANGVARLRALRARVVMPAPAERIH